MLELVSHEYGQLLDVAPGPLRERFLADLGHTTTKVGADAAVFDDRGRVLLVLRADDHKWGLVAGWVDPGEHPRDTVVRELAEEVGVEGVVDELVDVFAWPASAKDPHGFVAVVYLCSLRTFEFTLQPHEVLDAGWHDVDTMTDWHKNHEQYARAAAELWRQRQRK